MVASLKNEVSSPQDEGAVLLAEKLRRQEPFFFIRYGDGALECMAGHSAQTRDFEKYSPELSRGLKAAWDAVIGYPGLILGDWQTASFDAKSEYSRYREQYETLIGHARPIRIHFESLLLMRQSQALLDFYRAVKADSRRKLFMGPEGNAGAAKMLDADFLEVPMRDLLGHVDPVTDELLSRDFDVLLYGAGMAGNIPAVRCWQQHPSRTFINLGSAMDVLFRGRSRTQQLQVGHARHFFREFLPCFGACCTRRPVPVRRGKR
jgi:hypothetical protein